MGDKSPKSRQKDQKQKDKKDAAIKRKKKDIIDSKKRPQ